MIQLRTLVNIIDNSGGIIGRCIKILHPHNRKYAKIGDIILVSIKEVGGSNSKKSGITTAKDIAKGTMYKALVVRTKWNANSKSTSDDNAVILLKTGGLNDKRNVRSLSELTPLGTRIKGPISSLLNNNSGKYQKVLSLTKFHY